MIKTFSIDLEIDDPQELWRAARHKCIEDGLSEESTLDMIGLEDDPDFSGCLIAILDPGMSPDGTSIIESRVD